MAKRTKTERKRARAAQQNQAKWVHALSIGGPRREPNGRLSRRVVEVRQRQEMSEVEAKDVMMTARRRQFNLSDDKLDVVDAGKPNVGSVHGLLQIEGRITMDQYHAAEWYIEKRSAWARAVEVPGETLDKKETGRFDEDAHKAFCKTAKEEWGKIIACLRDASVESRSPIIAAMDCILVRQTRLDHLTGDLRLGLNAIRKSFL